MSDPTLGGRFRLTVGGEVTCQECFAVVAAESAALHVAWHDRLEHFLAIALAPAPSA